MKTAGILTVAAFAALASTVNAHGKMTKPEPREVTALYRENAGALANAGDEELTIAPIENLKGRSQTDFPESATFNLENGCRGFIYEEGNTVTTLTPGTAFDVEWWIQAPHPGYMNLSIVKPSTDSAGKITYEKYLTILNVDPFANTGGTDSTTATIPEGEVEGCENAGDCALQFWWHSDIAQQTYPSCADIIVSGSGAGSSASTPTATTAAPSTDSSEDAAETSADASVGGDADETETEAPATTTAAPAADDEYTPAPAADDEETEAPAATTAAPAADKCNVRRSRRE